MAHVRLKSKLHSKGVLMSMIGNGRVTVALKGVGRGVGGEISEVDDGMINAAAVAENKPHYGLHHSAMRHGSNQHKDSQR